MSWYKTAQLTNFLTQQGYSPQFVAYVATLPKHVQKAIGTEVNKNPGVHESWLKQVAQRASMQPIPQKQPKGITMPALEQRFKDNNEKAIFYSRVPKEFVPWVNGLLNNSRFQFIPSEDGPRMFTALKTFMSLREKPDVPIQKDINKYPDLLALEREIEKFVQKGPKAGDLQYDPAKLPGVTFIKTLEDGSNVYEMKNADSVAKLGVGTKWCTRADYPNCRAQSYLDSYGSLYLVTKGGKPVIQMTANLDQIMDVNDVPISLPRGLFGLFGERYAKKMGIPHKLLMQFSTEESANNSKLLLKAIKINTKAAVLASEQLKSDPTFMMEANKIAGEEALEYASEKLQANDDFMNSAKRIRGEFEYNFGHNDLDEDLSEIIYGQGNYGATPMQVWSFDDAYDSLEHYVNRNNRDGSGYIARRCGDVLGSAAVFSDIERIKAGYFDFNKIKEKANQLALSAKKHHKMEFQKNKPEFMDYYIGPYMEQAEKQVLLTHLKDVTPEFIIKQKTRQKAFENMQAEKEFNNIKSIEDLDPQQQKRFMCQAIDRISQIGCARNKTQKNNEQFDSNIYDSDLGIPDEPNELDYEDPNEYSSAYNEWEKDSETMRNDAESEYRKNSFPYNMDDDIEESLKKEMVKNKFRVPSWMIKFFGKETSYVPEMMHLMNSIARDKAEQAKMSRKKIRKKVPRRASGWYNLIKNSQVNPDIIIDSDLHGLGFKEDGEMVRIEAYDRIKRITVGSLLYTVQGNVLHIENIEVGETYKRQGIGTRMIEKMKQDHPGFKIDPGLVTHEGRPFFQNLKNKKVV